MSALHKPVPELLSERELVSAILDGRREFPGVTFTSKVYVDFASPLLRGLAVETLDFSHCQLGPDFSLSNCSVQELWLEYAHAPGLVGFYKPTIKQLHAKRLTAHRQFSISRGTIDGCDLSEGTYHRRFSIYDTAINILILDRCTAPEHFIDDATGLIIEKTEADADLGRKLTELQRQID